MKHIYVGCLVTPGQEHFIFDMAKARITQSATTFQRAFLSGFDSDQFKPEIINAADIGSWPKRCSKVVIPGSEESLYGMKCHNVQFFNITKLKQISIYKSIYRSLLNICKQNSNEEVLITLYSLLYPYLKAVADVKKRFSNIKICCIVPDLPEYFGGANILLDKVFGQADNIYDYAKYIDFYILLTEPMRERLNVFDKPYMVMEGIYSFRESQKVSKVPLSLLYTGKLDSRFGLKMLVDGFCQLKDPKLQLWICGDGDDRNYIINKAKEDSRISYLGLLKQEEVFRLQAKASVLINPRSPIGEYTKYSFPSKTMEYMASGTPTMMYKLPGMPSEYEPHLILFDDMSQETFIKTIDEWLHKPTVELQEFGFAARQFILNNKTNKKQIERYHNFIKVCYGLI